jgi:uncharacterized membrane protein YdbT with pleckstrin-like domain
MRSDANSAARKRWIFPTFMFASGAIIGMAFLASTSSNFWTHVPWPVQWLLIPGFVLLAPAYVLVGGVHGDHVGIVFRLIPLANGIAYALIAMAARRILGFRKPKKAGSVH